MQAEIGGGVVAQSPDELKPYLHASQREKSRRMNAFLRAVRRAYRNREASNLCECLLVVDGAGTEQAFHAKMLLTAMTAANPFEPDLRNWSTSRHTKRADVYRLLDRAIGHTASHRGGWLVCVPGGKQ